MDTFAKLSHIYAGALRIEIGPSSRFVILSDCHRGDGGQSDNFSKNRNLFRFALKHYYDRNFTYIELGDGDELWENRRFSDIVMTHTDIFKQMSAFYRDGRFYMIAGNHDHVKLSRGWAERNLTQYCPEHCGDCVPLFPDITVHEGLVLQGMEEDILLVHGHQGDPINDSLWRLGRFLVRYLWRPLEMIGIKNPTSASHSGKKKTLTEQRMRRWADCHGVKVIAGHTHRPQFPSCEPSRYYNDGSCVHPRCITAIEIEEETISLVKWSVSFRKTGSLFIKRDVLAGPERISPQVISTGRC